jgi:hypothetical protein
MPPIEHDAMCYEHARQVTLLIEQVKSRSEAVEGVIDRVQVLVDQYHTQNVAQAEMKGDVSHIRAKVDKIEVSLEKDFALRSEFAEIKSEWRKFLGLILGAIVLGLIGFVLRGGLK